MEPRLASGKRLASVRYSHECPEASLSGANKRSRQHVGHQYVWQSRAPAQLSSALRRVQSAPVAAENLEQEIWNDLEHWRSREAGARRPSPTQIAAKQAGGLTSCMRATLVDWLGEVRDEFRLHGETLFLSAAYLDAFLAAKPVSRDRLQLLGMASLWVAAKFEEVYPPPLSAMLAMAENMYSAADLKGMEKELLFTLDFGLAVPTPLRFLHYLLQLADLPAHPGEALSCRRLAEALLELSLLDDDLLAAPASAVAAAAVYLALGMCRHHAGLQGVVLLSGVDPIVLGELVQRLSRNLLDAASRPQQQPRALLSRYRAWEELYGPTGYAIAAATAQQSTQPTPPAAAAAAAGSAPLTGAAATAQDDADMAGAAAGAAAAGMMEHELEVEAAADEEDPHASPSPSVAAYRLHHLPAQHPPTGSYAHLHAQTAAYAPAAALAAAGGLVAASGGAAALMHGAAHTSHHHFAHHHHVMSLATLAHHHHHHVPVTASAAGASTAAALGGLVPSPAGCH